MTKAQTIFEHPWVLSLLLAMPLLTIAQLVAAWRGRRLLLRLGQPAALAGLMPAPRRFRWLSALLVSLGVTALVAGAAGPHWGRDPRPAVVAGRDLVVLLDMSNSMRATDAPPDRFHRSAAAIAELAAYARARGGHRLGLVVFAGDAQIVCPLTYDYDLFRAKLEALDMDHPPLALRPREGMKSGTRIGAGLRQAVAIFEPATTGFQDVMLLSDGDDPVNDGEWEAGLKAIESNEVPFTVVGVGDPASESLLAVPGREEKVRTRLREGPLQAIARRTGGYYHAARLEPPHLVDLFRQRIEPKGETTPQADPPPLPQPRQVWFYLTALACFGLAWLVQLRRADVATAYSWLKNLRGQPVRPTRKQGSESPTRKQGLAAAAALALFLLAAAPPSPLDWQRRGDAAFDAGRFDEAAKCYAQAEARTSEPGRVAYNAGVANFNLGRYREAERLFRCSLESSDFAPKSRAWYNLGTCLLHASDGRDAHRLGEAIQCFERTLKQSGLDESGQADARHNLELAKLLWRRVNSNAPPPESEPGNRDNPNTQEQPDQPMGDEPGTEPGTGTTGRRVGQVPAGPDGQTPMQTDKQGAPGTGQMSPISDAEQQNPLPPQEARALLQQAGERIRRERRTLERSMLGDMRGYPDW